MRQRLSLNVERNSGIVSRQRDMLCGHLQRLRGPGDPSSKRKLQTQRTNTRREKNGRTEEKVQLARGIKGFSYCESQPA